MRQGSSEPFRLKAWQLTPPASGLFYTCARPGRSLGTKAKVPDQLVRDWAIGLPGGPEVFIISLLGDKRDGRSELSFYSFFGKQSLQNWLDANVVGRKFRIIDYPTTDLEPIPASVLAAIGAEVRQLVSENNTVVIVDSGGWTRTGDLAAHLGAVKAEILR